MPDPLSHMKAYQTSIPYYNSTIPPNPPPIPPPVLFKNNSNLNNPSPIPLQQNYYQHQRNDSWQNSGPANFMPLDQANIISQFHQQPFNNMPILPNYNNKNNNYKKNESNSFNKTNQKNMNKNQKKTKNQNQQQQQQKNEVIIKNDETIWPSLQPQSEPTIGNINKTTPESVLKESFKKVLINKSATNNKNDKNKEDDNKHLSNKATMSNEFSKILLENNADEDNNDEEKEEPVINVPYLEDKEKLQKLIKNVDFIKNTIEQHFYDNKEAFSFKDAILRKPVSTNTLTKTNTISNEKEKINKVTKTKRSARSSAQKVKQQLELDRLKKEEEEVIKVEFDLINENFPDLSSNSKSNQKEDQLPIYKKVQIDHNKGKLNKKKQKIN
jgi:hypothetical protein